MRPPETPPRESRPELPKKLYHASPVADLEEIRPRAESVRDPEEGPRVFATPDRALATVFLASGRFVRGAGLFGDVPYALVRDRENFLKQDKGGVIYELSPDGFGCKPDVGLGVKEWTCPTSVKPVGKTVVSSALEAMLEAGVQVYFVDDETLGRIEKAEDHGLAILRSTASENQVRGINPAPFPDGAERA